MAYRLYIASAPIVSGADTQSRAAVGRAVEINRKEKEAGERPASFFD
jgi:hypothetical protein